MKKLLILAAGLTTLSLGSCNRQSCPAYGNRAEVHRSTAVPATATASAAPVAAERL